MNFTVCALLTSFACWSRGGNTSSFTFEYPARKRAAGIAAASSDALSLPV